MRLRGWAALGAMLAVGACSASAPQLGACAESADGGDKLQAKLAACSAVIQQGAKGDGLEQALAQRGEAHRLLSDNKAAMADFDQALRLKANDVFALDGRGLVYRDDGKPDLALADFDAAIRADPNDAAAYENRGYLERDRGDFNAAVGDDSHAIELDPDTAQSWANRGYDYAGKRQWDSALADFNEALRHDETYVYAIQGRAESERGKGDAKAALKDFMSVLNDPNDENALPDANAVVELSPAGDPDALNARCWVRGVQNTELAAALADCQQALAVRPNSAETLDSLAFVFFRQGRFSDAANEYSAALAANPNLASSRFMRGIAKLRAGDQAGGEADIAQARAADKGIADRYAGWGVTP